MATDTDLEGDFAFMQIDGQNTFSEILAPLNGIQTGPTIVAVIGLGVLLLWDKILSKKGKLFTLIQGPLVAVVIGIIYFIVTKDNQALSINASHLVQVPVPEDLASFKANLQALIFLALEHQRFG